MTTSHVCVCHPDHSEIRCAALEWGPPAHSQKRSVCQVNVQVSGSSDVVAQTHHVASLEILLKTVIPLRGNSSDGAELVVVAGDGGKLPKVKGTK